MEAQFYWQAIKRYWWLILLPVVVTVAGLIAFDRIRGPQYQTTIYFLVNGPFALTSADYPTGSSLRLADDQVYPQLDFANVANSLQVSAKTIADLDLPVDNALDLLKPPIFELRAPSVMINLGQPQGDALSQGLLTDILGSSANKMTKEASTRLIELQAIAYDPRTAETLAQTYARNAIDLYRKMQAESAAFAQQQLQSHLQQARRQLDVAEAELARFETDNKLLSGGSEFTTAQQTLDDLKKERANLVAAAGGQATLMQRLAELDQEIAALEARVDQLAKLAGDAQAKSAADRAAAESRVAAAQAAYSQALQAYINAQTQFSLAKAQGFPATRPVVQSSTTSGSQTTRSAVETTPGSTETTTTSTQTKTDENRDVPVGLALQDSFGSTTGSSTTTTTTTIPERRTTTTETTQTTPTTSTVTIEEPNPIQSEEQGLAYVYELGLTADDQAKELAAAQQQLAALQANDPAQSLVNQLENDRAKLAALRQTRSALLTIPTDSEAGLRALDALIAQQEQRIAFLNSISPQYNRLQASVEQARQQVQQLSALADRYARLQADAAVSAGVQMVDTPYTMRLPSKLALSLVFGVLIGLFFGIALALGVAYIGHLRSLSAGKPDGGAGGPNGATPKPEEIPTYPGAAVPAPERQRT